ncbi:hypothetical protein JXC34_03045 [Candidatus Woesearchaeota archaeon]|nr:hypothetical protein [Candidatus Woesearchaeota archaeon]
MMVTYIANARQGIDGQLRAVPFEEGHKIFPKGYVPPVEYVEGAINVVTGSANTGLVRNLLEQKALEIVSEDGMPEGLHVHVIEFGSQAGPTNGQYACLK